MERIVFTMIIYLVKVDPLYMWKTNHISANLLPQAQVFHSHCPIPTH